MNTFKSLLTLCQQRVDQQLRLLLPTRGASQPLQAAMLYSVFNGGKRIRPMLVYAAHQAIVNTHNFAESLLPCSTENNTSNNKHNNTKNTNEANAEISPHSLEACDQAAAALESIHAYSLIHDDLPAMDDDDLRRGQATCHIAFNEATAILAGDALQSLAFEALCQITSLTAEQKLAMIHTLAKASGDKGMVAGQAIDMAATEQQLTLTQLQTMHNLKTGTLIRASVELGARASGRASTTQLQQLNQYASAIGLAFQVQDDILDVTANTATLGKTQGADQAHNKPTYVSLLGLEAAQQKAQDLHQQALTALEHFDTSAEPLRQLSEYIISRSH